MILETPKRVKPLGAYARLLTVYFSAYAKIRLTLLATVQSGGAAGRPGEVNFLPAR